MKKFAFQENKLLAYKGCGYFRNSIGIMFNKMEGSKW